MTEAILAFLAVGTYGFWLFLSILSIFFIYCNENDHRIAPNLLFIGTIVIYWKSLVTLDWQLLVGTFVGYLVMGIAWSVFKWMRFVSHKVDEYKEKYGSNLTDDQRISLKRDLNVTYHKSRVTGWITFWPWGIIWTLTGDLWNALYDAMKSTYEKISDSGMSKFGTITPEDKSSKNRGPNW